MNEREFNRLRTQIKAEYQKKLEALDMVWKMCGGATKGSRTPPRGALASAVRQAVDARAGTFTVRDIEHTVCEANPGMATTVNRTSVSSALKRMANDDLITIASLGRGKRATIYDKAVSVKAGERPF